MKSHATKLLVAATLILVGLPSFAQTLKANVPFDFIANNTRVAAGALNISEWTSNYRILRNEAGKGLLLCHVMKADEKSGKPKLVFNRYGADYYLAEIWTGEQVEKVPAGKQLRHIAQLKTPDEVVAVALTGPMNDAGR
jgi:hypothetical protein